MAASSSSATVAVEKATSDLLMGPDWTMNIEICDSINSNHWQPKDVVKAVKKRLQHKSSKVQLLALTLLETMVKNCGDYVHFQIAERNILDEMIKIVRKKADMQVREKILLLLDSWQEAFGGPGGKHPQYYWAYEELKRSGVVFPKRSLDAAPIFTPPPTHPALRSMHPGYGMPSSSSKTLDETMATEIESLSLSSLESMRHVMDLLSDMLQAVNPSDRAAVKDEVIIDLVDRCRTNQKKLMQMLTTTGDEELLGRGLELNDTIQSLLARHDAIASGTPLPIHAASSSTASSEVHRSVYPTGVDQTDVKSSSPVESVSTPKASPPAPVFSQTKSLSDEEEEDEFALLARRHSKTQSVTSKDSTTDSMNTSSTTSNVPESPTTVPSNALALPGPPAPVSTAKDQDIIDLLNLTLSLAPSSPQTSYTPPNSSQGVHQTPVPSRTEGYSYASQAYAGNSQYNSYVVPWAQPQSQSESQPQPRQMYQPPSQSHSQPATPPSPPQLHTQYEFEQSLHHQQSQQFQSQSPFQTQHPQYTPRQQQLQPHQETQPLPYQSQPQALPHLQSQPQSQQHLQSQPQSQQHLQPQPQFQPQQQLQPQPQPQFQSQQQLQPPPQPHPQPQQQLQHKHPQPQQHLQSQPQSQPHLQPQPQFQPPSQPQPQPQFQSQQQLQPHPQPQQQPQQQSQHQHQPQPQSQPQPQHIRPHQPQPQFQNQHPQYPARYPPPPWAATPGYPNYQNHLSASNVFSTPQASTTGPFTPAPGVRSPLQHTNTFPTKGVGGSAIGGDPKVNSGPYNPASAAGQKPFVPSYRLFEDLNVFGNTDGRVKMTGSGTSSGLSGTMGPGMVGGRK